MNKSCKKIVPGLLLAGLLAGGCSPSTENQVLVFESLWIRPMPPGMKMTAGFGQLTNNGPAAMEIIAFSSPSFDDVSLHRTEQVDGVSKMRAVGALSVAAGETVELAPGGYHLMFMMPTGETEQGGRVKLSMRTTDGREFTFDLPVERR